MLAIWRPHLFKHACQIDSLIVFMFPLSALLSCRISRSCLFCCHQRHSPHRGTLARMQQHPEGRRRKPAQRPGSQPDQSSGTWKQSISYVYRHANIPGFDQKRQYSNRHATIIPVSMQLCACSGYCNVKQTNLPPLLLLLCKTAVKLLPYCTFFESLFQLLHKNALQTLFFLCVYAREASHR